MQIRDIMNTHVTTTKLGTTMRHAAELLSRSDASDLMVVGDTEEFVGVLSEGDLVRSVMPRFEDLMFSSGSLMEAFEVFAEQGRGLADSAIDALVIREPVAFDPSDHVLKAASAMVARQIRRLPVVQDGKLVGTVSRADVARAVLQL